LLIRQELDKTDDSNIPTADYAVVLLFSRLSENKRNLPHHIHFRHRYPPGWLTWKMENTTSYTFQAMPSSGLANVEDGKYHLIYLSGNAILRAG